MRISTRQRKDQVIWLDVSIVTQPPRRYNHDSCFDFSQQSLVEEEVPPILVVRLSFGDEPRELLEEEEEEDDEEFLFILCILLFIFCALLYICNLKLGFCDHNHYYCMLGLAFWSRICMLGLFIHPCAGTYTRR